VGLAFTAVRQTQSILATDAALAPARPELNLHRLWRPLLVLAGCVAGVILALALSAAGARSAGATTVPVAPATPVLTAAITAANATVTTTAPAIDAGAVVIPPVLANTVATVNRALPAVASSLLPAGTLSARVPVRSRWRADGRHSSPWSRHASTVSDVNARRSRRSHCPAHAAHVDPRRNGGPATPTCTFDRIRLADQPVTTPCAASSHARPIAGSTVASDMPASQGGGPLGRTSLSAWRYRRSSSSAWGSSSDAPATSPRSPVLPTWLSTSVVFCAYSPPPINRRM